MITFIVVLLTSVFIQKSSALNCMGCEITNSSEACNFSYTCPKGIEYCETLISKVEGNYSIILSCATMEKCGENSQDQGFDQCDHKESNTECFSCCKKNKCNGLKRAIKKLSIDISKTEKQQSELHDHEEGSSSKIEDVSDEYGSAMGTDNKTIERDEKVKSNNVTSKEITKLRNHEVEVLKKIGNMIESDEKKLDNGETIYENNYNEIDLVSSSIEKTKNNSYNEVRINSTTPQNENTTSSTVAKKTVEVTTVAPVNVTEVRNVTNEYPTFEEDMERPPIFEEVEDSEDPQGEHHALKGASSSLLKNDYSFLVITTILIAIRQFTN